MWENAAKTLKGIALDQKLTIAEKPLRLTAAKCSDGILNGDFLLSQEDLVGVAYDAELKGAYLSDDGTMLTFPVTFTNTLLDASFRVHEVGIFAEDPGGGEILYFIAYDEEGVSVPAKEDSPGFSVDWYFNYKQSNASDITIEVTEAGRLTVELADMRYAKKEDVAKAIRDHNGDPEAHPDIRQELGTVKKAAEEALKSAQDIAFTITNVPTQNGSLTYTGGTQSPQWNFFNEDALTIGGTTEATDAGTYEATFTPKEKYKWDDGTSTERTAAWTIGKAAGTLTLDKDTVNLTNTAKTATVNVTRDGDGAVSAVSDHTEFATASVADTVITVTGVKNGSATVTVSVAESKNYTAPAAKTIAVNVKLTDPNLANNSPADIQAAAKSGQAKNLWRVGDRIPIKFDNKTVGKLTLNGTYYAVILGFDHNAAVEGANTIHFQIGKDGAGKDIAFVSGRDDDSDFYMNSSNTNVGGWNSSYMRTAICTKFFAAMPAEWQSVITACTKYSDNKGNGSNAAGNVTTTQDKIFLLSEFEVQGKRTHANTTEQNYQKQYDYYRNGNSMVKYEHSNNSSASSWWLRSVYAVTALSFCCVTSSGKMNYPSARQSCGVSPAFKIS